MLVFIGGRLFVSLGIAALILSLALRYSGIEYDAGGAQGAFYWFVAAINVPFAIVGEVLNEMLGHHLASGILAFLAIVLVLSVLSGLDYIRRLLLSACTPRKVT